MPSKTEIYLSDGQLKKALNRKTFQISASSMRKEPNAVVELSKTDLNRLKKNAEKGKGFRFQANEFSLIEPSGETEGGKLRLGRLFKRASRVAKKQVRKGVNQLASRVRKEANRVGQEIKDNVKERGKDVLKQSIRGATKGAMTLAKSGTNYFVPGSAELLESQFDKAERIIGRKTDRAINKGLGLKKGSAEAKERMAQLRAMRGSNKKVTNGGAVKGRTETKTKGTAINLNDMLNDVVGGGEATLLARVPSAKRGGSFLPY